MRGILSVGLMFLLFYLLFWKGWILWILLGLVVLVAAFVIYFRFKVHKASRPQERDTVERPSDTARDSDAPIVDDGKIKVTDLSGAKEVEFEKE